MSTGQVCNAMQCNAMQCNQLKPNDKHQPIPDRDDDAQGDDTAGHTSRDEMLDLQVALARFGHFHHYGGHVWEACKRISR